MENTNKGNIAKKNELSWKQLENVVGGKLTQKARDWVTNNKEQLLEIAAEHGMTESTVYFALNIVENSATVFDVDDLKNAIYQFTGIDVSDIG